MANKIEGGCHVVDFQPLASTKQLETSTKERQIFYLFRSGAMTGGMISRGADIHGASSSKEYNPIPERMRAYVDKLAISMDSECVVVSSTAKRAIETAEPFVNAFKEKNTPVILLENTEELVERRVGEQAGQPRQGDAYDLKVKAWKLLSAAEKFKNPEMQGYESFETVAIRTTECLKRIAKDNPSATCFVFTHVHNIEAAVIELLNLELSHEPKSHMPLEHLNPLEALMVIRTGDQFVPTLRLMNEEQVQ